MQGEEAEIQYKSKVEELKSEIGVGKQGTGILRPGINFIVKVRFLASYWHGIWEFGPLGPMDGPRWAPKY